MSHDGAGLKNLLNGPGVIPACQILNKGWQLQGPGSEGEHLVEIAHALQLMVYFFETFGPPRDISPIKKELFLQDLEQVLAIIKRHGHDGQVILPGNWQ